MGFKLDSALGIHSEAIALRNRRLQVIASNLANADTPNYLARDYDFRQALADAGSGPVSARRTHTRHLAGVGSAAGAELMYRNPLHPAIDGNTVDAQLEQTAFADNAVRMQASLMFLDGRIRGIREAITGGLR